MSNFVENLWEDHRDADIILIDVPIDLQEKSDEKQYCDSKGREKLSLVRHLSVFPTPIRDVVYCDNYESAKAKQEELTDGSLDTQTWVILDKIGELDPFPHELRRSAGNHQKIHSEVCF